SAGDGVRDTRERASARDRCATSVAPRYRLRTRCRFDLCPQSVVRDLGNAADERAAGRRQAHPRGGARSPPGLVLPPPPRLAAMLVVRERKWAWQMSAVAAAVALPYLFYLVFDDWESTRFLLPTILIILILAAQATSQVLAQRAPVLLLAIALVCAVASHRF